MINGHDNNETNAINVDINVKSKNSETKTTAFYCSLNIKKNETKKNTCLLYTSPSPRD